MIFAWAEPRTASYHLTIEASHFGGPQHYNAIHGWAIPTLSQQHGVAQDIVFAVRKVLQDLRPVPALAVNLRRSETGTI